MSIWRRGDHIEVRLLGREGEALARLPHTVVEDDGNRVVGWLEPGTPIAWWALKDGSDPRELDATERFEADIVSTHREWEGTGVVRVMPLDAAYSVLHFWNDDGSFRCWYVNFETPKLRRPFGLETIDLVLDLVLLPDGSYFWKDEDEVAPAVSAGWVTEEQAGIARAAGDEILRDVDGWLAELGDWRAFRPEPSWSTPQLVPIAP